ncbi:hypothetical protein Tco_1104401 [Tanacetum coccineum]
MMKAPTSQKIFKYQKTQLPTPGKKWEQEKEKRNGVGKGKRFVKVSYGKKGGERCRFRVVGLDDHAWVLWLLILTELSPLRYGNVSIVTISRNGFPISLAAVFQSRKYQLPEAPIANQIDLPGWRREVGRTGEQEGGGREEEKDSVGQCGKRRGRGQKKGELEIIEKRRGGKLSLLFVLILFDGEKGGGCVEGRLGD